MGDYADDLIFQGLDDYLDDTLETDYTDQLGWD